MIETEIQPIDHLWDELRCFLGFHKLYPVVVDTGASYKRENVTIKATDRPVTIRVCPICNFMRVFVPD